MNIHKWIVWLRVDVLWTWAKTSSWLRQLGDPGRVCNAMKKDQSDMIWARTDLVAVLVVVVACAGWCLWGS